MYTLRFPFELPPGQEIAGGYRGKLGHLTVEMTQRERGYLVLVEGLESEDAAKKYADTLWAALKWVLLEKKLPVQASYDLQEVIPLPDNTDKVLWGLPVKDRTAVIEEGFPAVFPSETSFFRLKINVPSGVVSFSADNVGQVLVEGLTFPHCADVLADSKLKLALELYGAYWTETSPNAKFLTLVMALEVLTPGDNRPPRVLALLDQWESELNELRRQDDLQPEESKSLASLSGSLTTFLRQNSITSEIRDL